MAELQPPESTTVQINGNGSAAAASTAVSAGAILPGAATISAGFLPVTSSETLGATKRQRRPSVRLGDLGGDQTFDSHSRRAPKPWKTNQSHGGGGIGGISVENRAGRESTTAAAKASSKTRSMVNFSETLESEEREREGNLEAMAIGSWRHGISKESSVRKRGGGGGGGGLAAAKRVRSNWISSAKSGDGEEKFSGGDDADENNDDDVDGGGENSDSPANSMDEERENVYARRHSRISDRHNHRDGVDVLSAPSDTEAREWIGNGHGEDGVRVWLNGLGLSRYAPVFEIHEVDDEVLPMLTLEDLKDMGINAVGSRRKMFSAIQKLGKGFS